MTSCTQTCGILSEKSENKIRWLSCKNLYVWFKVQFDNLYIFSGACLTLHTGFRDFHRHFKFLRSLEFDFWADFTNRPVRNSFFPSPINFFEKSEKDTGRKTLIDGYNHFGSSNSIREIWTFESPESRKSSKRPSATLCVKVKRENLFKNRPLR